MWLYVPREFCPSAPVSEDSILESDWRFQALSSSSTLRGISTAPKCLYAAWRRGGWIRRLFGQICEPSMAARGVARWISSLPACRVRTIDSPAGGHARQASGTSGRPPGDCFGRWSRVSSSSKMCLVSCGPTASRDTEQDSLESSMIWPKWGGMQNTVLYRRAPLVPHTHVRGCFFWPSPRASSRDNCGGQNARQAARKRGTYVGARMNPEFLESLMAFPAGWTATQRLATQSFRSWRRWLSPLFGNASAGERGRARTSDHRRPARGGTCSPRCGCRRNGRRGGRGPRR